MEMNIADKIDHTMLKADASEETIRRYCREAAAYGFASVCVNSCHVPLVSQLLKETGVKVCCVSGFPLGAMSTAAKAFESRQAVSDGADEVDKVINLGALKDGNDERVEEDIRQVVQAAKNVPGREPALVKVILETCLLTKEEIVRACRLAEKAGADYVKTSTGFSTGGATVEDVALMKETVGGRMKVKASGGIRTPEQARAMLAAGADRLGAGNGVILLDNIDDV